MCIQGRMLVHTSPDMVHDKHAAVLNMAHSKNGIAKHCNFGDLAADFYKVKHQPDLRKLAERSCFVFRAVPRTC